MTTARHIMDWRYTEDGQAELTITWTVENVVHLVGDEADRILTMIKCGAGPQEIEDQIGEMGKEGTNGQ